jgi:hypothetical protein
MATTKTHVGVPWDGRTAYERWVEDDLRVDLHRGCSGTTLGAPKSAIDLLKAALVRKDR